MVWGRSQGRGGGRTARKVAKLWLATSQQQRSRRYLWLQYSPKELPHNKNLLKNGHKTLLQPTLRLMGNVRTEEKLAHVSVHPPAMTTSEPELTRAIKQHHSSPPNGNYGHAGTISLIGRRQILSDRNENTPKPAVALAGERNSRELWGLNTKEFGVKATNPPFVTPGPCRLLLPAAW